MVTGTRSCDGLEQHARSPKTAAPAFSSEPSGSHALVLSPSVVSLSFPSALSPDTTSSHCREIVTNRHLSSRGGVGSLRGNYPMKALLIGIPSLAVSLVPAFAQFSPNPITGAVTTSQSVSIGTSTVSSTGSITVGSGNAVVMSGSSTVVNNGTIQQTGGGRGINNSVNGSDLTINNAGRILAVSSDAIRIDSAATHVSITNSGTISVSDGGQALDLAAITTGTNIVTNLASGVISTLGEDAVRPGRNGVVNNAGLILATLTSGTAPAGGDGIDVRTFTGISVTNTGTIAGRHGIATDGNNAGPSLLTVTNNAGGTIQAFNGSGINVDGLSTSVVVNVTNALGATIKGGVDALATNGDGDGVDVDGIVTLVNSGDILGLGAKGTGSDGGANNAEAISIGGGTITNNATGQIIGSTTSADAPNGDPTRAGNGILVDNSSGGNALAALNLTNSGLVHGKSGFAVKTVGSFADTITNNAGGVIRGSGTNTVAVQTGGGSDTVTNRGSIVGDSGRAIDLEDGDDTLIVEGGAASVTGNISGGAGANTMTIKPGAGNSFSYSGTISNFNSVTVESGTVTFSGNNTYAGDTNVDGGVLRLMGAGNIGTGDVRVSSAAVLDITGITAGTLVIGAGRDLAVDGTVRATGKTLVAGGQVGRGTGHGLVDVEGAFHLQGSGDLVLDVDGLTRGVTYDALDVSGLFTLDGSVIVSSNYVFALNDSLNLIDFGSIDASGFNMSNLMLPTLAGGLTWNTSNFTTDGTVSVVPEPSTALLIFGGSAVLGLLRRRRIA